MPEPEKPTGVVDDSIPKDPLWKRWISPTIWYGGTFALAYAAYQHIDWKALISEDMPQKITYLSMYLGGVALVSYMLKIGTYKDRLSKLYPEDQRLSSVKAFLTIYSQGLWTSFAGISILIRQILDFSKIVFFQITNSYTKLGKRPWASLSKQAQRLRRTGRRPCWAGPLGLRTQL